MNKKSTHELSTKMFLYSAHEQSIFNIYSILNGGKGREASIKPDFSSSVMIELHTVEEQNIVQVLMRKLYYPDFCQVILLTEKF